MLSRSAAGSLPAEVVLPDDRDLSQGAPAAFDGPSGRAGGFQFTADFYGCSGVNYDDVPHTYVLPPVIGDLCPG